MKQILVFLSVLLLSSGLSAQRAPAKVRKALERQYPESRDVKWEYEGERYKEWTARFYEGKDSLTVTYDHKGNWLLSLRNIPLEQLPQTVIDAIRDEYHGAKLIVAAIYEEPGFTGYGVAFHYKKDRWGVQISKEGKIIRRKLTSEGFDF
ncbi:MAG: PepSY-like domain-containing protein [bacterium]